ncbi:transmembrane amino acid transporter [Colletotrichum paranaense]|uniref:Transmembrane amino acid transporter n=2 Tax=Colletotrichum acutatum species complex TaxID=2707335 RepID=A0AAI9UA94_9PEZI|nr:transmembrane amino acid transporter [Colletotrichum paranaense]KAK1454594.1 transmembrane amino acid transporter [Colletotrichum melonis]KAK1520098.1 transmembrane amino acid transporter [Colletotrichum paranaense]
MPSRNPSTWDEYERGASPQRSVSIDSNAVAEDQSLLGEDDDGDYGSSSHGLRRRRLLFLTRAESSVTRHLAAITDIGGVNSIRSFTRSWARAAGFAEVIPQRPSFVFAPDQVPIASSSTDGLDYSRSHVESGSHPRTSLLRQHLEATPETAPSASYQNGSSASGADDSAVQTDFRDRERKAVEAELSGAFRGSSFGSGRRPSQSIFAVPPHLATPPLVGSFSSYRTYGTIADVDEPSMAQAGELWRQQQEAGGNVPDGENMPILVKEVEQDGKIILTVEGQSTLPQTIFNSINVLIGVGLLSLPMGIKYAGWICGMIVLAGSAAVTAYTAKLLAKCMDLDASLITFSDLAYISYGRNARIATSILFTLELLAACVALIVLFADSLTLLFPGFLSVNMWKLLCSIIMIPLNFLPLRLLSFTSVIGIVCCFSIVLILVVDGLIKPTTPGSLIEPATTYLFPANWGTLPLSFGLLMSPWGGHSVFPNIYRDMRHPHKYPRAVKTVFTSVYLLDAFTAVVGLLMYGDGVMDEITANILQTSGYPRALNFLLCIFIAIIPLTKIPLNARPIVATLEVLTGIHQQAVADSSAMVGRSATFRGIMKVVIRVVTVLVFLVISILFPAFDSIMAFMGSALCFTICVLLPLAFYVKLFSKEISPQEKLLCYVLMTISTILSVVGTVWAFLPKSLIGAE